MKTLRCYETREAFFEKEMPPGRKGCDVTRTPSCWNAYDKMNANMEELLLQVPFSIGSRFISKKHDCDGWYVGIDLRRGEPCAIFEGRTYYSTSDSNYEIPIPLWKFGCTQIRKIQPHEQNLTFWQRMTYGLD